MTYTFEKEAEGSITFADDSADDHYWELTDDDIGAARFGWVAKQCKRCGRAEGGEIWFESERKRDARCPLCGALVINQDRHKVARKGDRHKNARKDLRKGDRHTVPARGRIVNRLDDPFLAIDGEGGGVNEYGQQNYLLLTAWEETGEPHVLFKDNERLTTIDCLEFIVSLPKRKNIVGFHFDYDVTMILRDLTAERLVRLFAVKEKGRGHSPYT
jgi:DNA-directed RNA polymerase subunit RPC12/RpoP